MITIIPRFYDDDYKIAVNTNNPRWRSTRDAVINRDGGKCRFCGCKIKESLQAHHISYYNSKGEVDYFEMKNLITLCQPCHQIVSDAVKAAKGITIEIPAFAIRPGVFVDEQIKTHIKNASYAAEQELVVNALFKIWIRSLRSDCEGINMRNLDVMKPIGNIVEASIECQAGRIAGEYSPAFAGNTISKITNYLQDEYIKHTDKGKSDQEFRTMYRLNYQQMVKIRKNAYRVRHARIDSSG